VVSCFIPVYQPTYCMTLIVAEDNKGIEFAVCRQALLEQNPEVHVLLGRLARADLV
jgi:hypothetical protein